MDQLTDFGFERIAAGHKGARVRAVFDAVAGRYDLMNDLMSLGLHRLWKDAMVAWLRPRPGMRLIDVAGGTGDIAFRYLAALDRRDGAAVTVADINHEMLAVGRRRAARRGLADAVEFVCADAERLPFPDGAVDAVTVAFGVRNMTDKPAALAEMRRVLRPGGRFLCLEFSRLALPGLEKAYDAYSLRLLPAIGARVTGDREAYRYLAESIRTFPDQDAFAAMIEDAGLALARYRNLAGGVAALHSAWRI